MKAFRSLTLRVVFVVVLPCTTMGSQVPLGPEDRTVLEGYARDTWRSIVELAAHGELPADGLRRNGAGWAAYGPTSPTNIASYVWSVVAAEDLRLITAAESETRLRKVLKSLERLERAHGFFYGWYEHSSGARALKWPGGGTIRPLLSSVDNAWLALSLMIVGEAHAELRPTTDSLLQPMNFGFFYNPYDPSSPKEHPGLLHGGYWTDDGTFTEYHYATLNSEPRIASYIAIARGEVPPDHYYRMIRGASLGSGGVAPAHRYAGVTVKEGANVFRGLKIVPSWDGTMFEALMVPLFVPEEEWAPRSWGVNHPLYARAQIEYGMKDGGLGYWGISASCDPTDGYRAYGIAGLSLRESVEGARGGPVRVVSPHAAFLALPHAPADALANLQALQRDFPVYGPMGFFDSVDVASGQVADRVLVLDQGMIMGSIAKAIGTDRLRKCFATSALEKAVRPLMAAEEFSAGVIGEPRRRTALVRPVARTAVSAAN